MLTNPKLKTPNFKEISDVRNYLVNLDKEGKIDLQKITPGEFPTLCQIILDCQDLAEPNSVNNLIKLTREILRH